MSSETQLGIHSNRTNTLEQGENVETAQVFLSLKEPISWGMLLLHPTISVQLCLIQ